MAVNPATIQQVSSQVNKLGLAKRAQRIVIQRVENPPNPPISKKALNSKAMRVAIPVEEQEEFIEEDQVISELDEAPRESTTPKDESTTKQFEFDAPRWKDFSGPTYQVKRQILESVVLCEEVSPDIPTSDVSQDALSYVGTCDMWFTKPHRQHEPLIPDPPPRPLITPTRHSWRVSSTLSTQSTPQESTSFCSTSRRDRTPLLRRSKGNRVSSSTTSKWEDSSPLPPDSMALHLDEMEGIDPVEDELRSRMGLRTKATRVAISGGHHSPMTPQGTCQGRCGHGKGKEKAFACT